MTATTDPHQMLVRAMVDAVPASREAFLYNAEFRATVQMLANLWMMLGPALVAQADRQQAEMQRQVALLRAGELL